MSIADPTPRAYTLRLSRFQLPEETSPEEQLRADRWRKFLWNTHLTVNRGVQVWGDWLLTLRGGLPASLANDDSNRRILLALSWLSVESPASLVPQESIVARGLDFMPPGETRQEFKRTQDQLIVQRFNEILSQKGIPDEKQQAWRDACLPALMSRIRDDAVWVNRAKQFEKLQATYKGLTVDWACRTFLDLIGGESEYFKEVSADSSGAAESKDFVQKAGNWFSRNWGAGKKSDPSAIADALQRLASIDSTVLIGFSGGQALNSLMAHLGGTPDPQSIPGKLFKDLKKRVGWKGRDSKGSIALAKVRDAEVVTEDMWTSVSSKLLEEAEQQSNKAASSGENPVWMAGCRKDIENRIRMHYRTSKDLIWEHAVMLDHALRRVSGTHSWMKRAEASRKSFDEKIAKLNDREAVPQAARNWLDTFREFRSSNDNAAGEYLIHRRAIDGWEKVVDAWKDLGSNSNRQQRIDAARAVQSNLDDNDKFGDIQLFAGFGIEDDKQENPRSCLADDDAICVWQRPDGTADPSILKNYVEATVAEHDRKRFKAPAYRHPDPLRHPVYVDYGNSRWGITYSALKAAQEQPKLLEKIRKTEEKLAKARTDKSRAELEDELRQLKVAPELRRVSLDVWTGEVTESLPLRWQGKRLWHDLDLGHFTKPGDAATVSRADRFGRGFAGAGSEKGNVAVLVAEVFDQKEWNGRLQVSRTELDRLADLIYRDASGKPIDPDFDKLTDIATHPKAGRPWQHLKWFLSFSAKLKPSGPWLDLVAQGLPEGIRYKKGRNGWYLEYDVNKERKGRARLKLARLCSGLRILSFDLGHRYGAACAVWQTLSIAELHENIQKGKIVSGGTGPESLFVHVEIQENKLNGETKTRKMISRRIGSDTLPDGTSHPAPWARLERQFLIKLQGEDRTTRFVTQTEWGDYNACREFAGRSIEKAKAIGPNSELVNVRMDDLQKRALKLGRRGLRRLGDYARIAYALTATEKPVSGGKTLPLDTQEQRIDYILDALVLWHQLAHTSNFNDGWASALWNEKVAPKLGSLTLERGSDNDSHATRKKKLDAWRAALKPVAKDLADPASPDCRNLHGKWKAEWELRMEAWKPHLRWLRRLILPRIGKRPSGNDAEAFRKWKEEARQIRNAGGLSPSRLNAMRDLHQLLKAFRMRPEPDGLRKNVPELGDSTLTNFGRRILNQYERLREQRVKQLASRIVEAALGLGSEGRNHWNGRKRAQEQIQHTAHDPRFAPCHVVIGENLDFYRPEENRLRSVNRRLMDWAARNLRKYVIEGCQLNGLHFDEVSPAWTSRQDSRTSAPGIRCSEISGKKFLEAVRELESDRDVEQEDCLSQTTRWQGKLIRQLYQKTEGFIRTNDLTPEEELRLHFCRMARDTPEQLPSVIRLPQRGGDLFVSADRNSSTAALQADLNAAANIGLKALADPDWIGAWWFILVDNSTGQPVQEKLKGSPLWDTPDEPKVLLDPAVRETSEMTGETASTNSRGNPHKKRKKSKSLVYAWNPLFGTSGDQPDSKSRWTETIIYWALAKQVAINRLRSHESDEPLPW